MRTEMQHTDAIGLDTLPDLDVLGRLLHGQIAALQTVSAALPTIAKGAVLMEQALRGSGRLVYAGAGSSALMGNADGLELAGTFGIDPRRVVLCMAGGLPQSPAMPGETEDDVAQAARDVGQVRAGDVVIAITASGRTPYTVEFARLAKAAGAGTICIANIAEAEIFAHADVTICLPTPPELIAGSTRMGAGTAQKAALNMMSTLMGLRLGHVHDGLMINLRADNTKLRSRATATVMRIASVSKAKAAEALSATGGAVKPAILLLCGADSTFHAKTVLDQSKGHLRVALSALQHPTADRDKL